MDTLHLDLSVDATRRHIRDELIRQIPVGRKTVDRTVDAAGVPDCHHHGLPEIDATIDSLDVSKWVRADMHAIYRILAEAEAQVHGCTVEETHFHEVGDAEAIRNVLAICVAIEILSPQTITATPVQVGSGKVECAHGVLDIPAPATAAIIARGIPVCEEHLKGELCSPTSAAVILHFVDKFDD
jgi:uncharacterized protein (DUF111 family)